MSDDIGTPVPEYPGEVPDDALEDPGVGDHGLSGTLDSGYDLDAEGPAERSSTTDAADRGEVPDAREGRDG